MRSLLYKKPHPSGKLRYEVFKEAQRIKNKKYQETHKEALRENYKRYRQRHKEILNAKDRLRYQNNEELKERRRQRSYVYYYEHKDDPVFKAKQREAQRKYKEKKRLQKILQENDNQRR